MDKSTELMSKYLKQYHDSTPAELAEEIANTLSDSYKIVGSEYVIIRGKYNCGFIETIAIEKDSNTISVFLTKIVSISTSFFFVPPTKITDEIFYTTIYPKLQNIYQYIPKIIDIRIHNELVLITTEKIEGRYPQFSDFGIVQSISRDIESIALDKVQAQFIASPSGIDIREITAKQLLQSQVRYLWRIFNNSNGNMRIVELILHFHDMLNEIKISHLVDPVFHYSLCHGDFHFHNIHIHNDLGTVFDWNNLSIAPLGYDIAYYFSYSVATFSDIKAYYIDERFPESTHSHRDVVSILLFIQMLTTLWINHMSIPQLDSTYDECLYPAVKYAERIAVKYFNCKGL